MNAAWLNAAVLLALLPAVALAQTDATEPAAELEGPFALTVNHVPSGDVILVLKGDDVFIDRADLRTAGVEIAGGQDAEVAGRRMLRLGSVSPPLRFEVDEEAVELRIFAPAELLPHTAIDLEPRPPDIVYTTDTSAFFNYAPRVTDSGHVALYEEMGLSVDGALLFSSAYLSNADAPARGLTSLIVDDRPALMRYTFGDALVRSGALGSGGFVGGLTIARTYELDPYAIKTPRIGLSGSTPTPATVDILVNGTRVRSEQVAPGTFEIRNLLVGGGSGFAGYVIRDVFGNERHVVAPFYVSGDALNAGIEEFTYSVGALRNRVGAESWNYEKPVALAHHRRGLDGSFTVGGRAEASLERFGAGPSLTALAEIGQIDLDLGGSYDVDGQLGAAAQIAYSYASRLLGCGLVLRVNSNRYSNIELAPEEDRPVAALDAVISVPIGNRVTLSYRSSVAGARDEGVSTSVGAQTTVRITGWLSWLTTAGRSKRERAPADWEVTTTLSYVISGGYGAQATAGIDENQASLRLNTSKSVPSPEGFGYRASATIAEQVSGEGELRYQTTFGRYGAHYSVYAQRPALTLDAAGGIVVVPSVGVFPTLPVQSSFGLIRVPGVVGVRGYGNHQELGTTDRNGSLVVPNLLSYYGNHLSIAPEDVPLEYEMRSTEAVLAPPPRGVALAEFQVTMPRFYRGRAVVREGATRVIPKYGQMLIRAGGEEVISPLGEQGEFELSALEPGPHAALIEWDQGTCEFELMFPSIEQTVIDLGEVTCTRTPAEGASSPGEAP